jgi:hypothetical protein
MTSDATPVAAAAEMFVRTGATYGSRPWRAPIFSHGPRLTLRENPLIAVYAR